MGTLGRKTCKIGESPSVKRLFLEPSWRGSSTWGSAPGGTPTRSTLCSEGHPSMAQPVPDPLQNEELGNSIGFLDESVFTSGLSQRHPLLPQPHCYYSPGALLNPAVCDCPKAHRGLQSRTLLAGRPSPLPSFLLQFWQEKVLSQALPGQISEMINLSD